MPSATTTTENCSEESDVGVKMIPGSVTWNLCCKTNSENGCKNRDQLEWSSFSMEHLLNLGERAIWVVKTCTLLTSQCAIEVLYENAIEVLLSDA